MITLYQKHVNTWSKCDRCNLCETRRNTVLFRGKIPCDILFIGEAPGVSEDVIGTPFIGPAGKLLDNIIRRSIPHTRVTNQVGNATYEPRFTYAFTNLIACIPYEDPITKSKATEPPDEAIEACSDRLIQLIRIASPRLLVAVGAIPRDRIEPGYKHSLDIPLLCSKCKTVQSPHELGLICRNKHINSSSIQIPRIDITHPAAILRANIAHKGLMIQRCIANIQTALEDVFLS